MEISGAPGSLAGNLELEKKKKKEPEKKKAGKKKKKKLESKDPDSGIEKRKHENIGLRDER